MPVDISEYLRLLHCANNIRTMHVITVPKHSDQVYTSYRITSSHMILYPHFLIQTYLLHQQNVFKSLGASKSVWEDVEWKLRSVNCRRVSDPRRAFRPALGGTGISDDWYRNIMGVIVIGLGTRQRAGENFGYTWDCCRTNVGITSNLWPMPAFLWIFTQRTAGVFWDSPDVHEEMISLNTEYDASIIVHYHFRIILAIIFFNIVVLPRYIREQKKKVSDSNINTGHKQ